MRPQTCRANLDLRNSLATFVVPDVVNYRQSSTRPFDYIYGRRVTSSTIPEQLIGCKQVQWRAYNRNIVSQEVFDSNDLDRSIPTQTLAIVPRQTVYVADRHLSKAGHLESARHLQEVVVHRLEPIGPTVLANFCTFEALKIVVRYLILGGHLWLRTGRQSVEHAKASCAQNRAHRAYL